MAKTSRASPLLLLMASDTDIPHTDIQTSFVIDTAVSLGPVYLRGGSPAHRPSRAGRELSPGEHRLDSRLARDCAISPDAAKAKTVYRDLRSLSKDAKPGIPILKKAGAEQGPPQIYLDTYMLVRVY
jgi:hypothetical protein